MEQNLLLSASNLTLFGMGFVFIFLTILVFITKFMSYLINTIENKYRNTEKNTLMIDDTVDEEAKFVIEQAIKIHTGA